MVDERITDSPGQREERFTADPVPPWELPGAFRLDCEPDRVWLLQTILIAGVLLAALSPCLLPTLLSVPLGTAAWALARRDLSRMRAGLMDPRGEERTAAAEEAGFIIVLWGLFSWLVWLLIWWVWRA